MEYPAHIRKVDGKKYIQTVEEHCRGVAEIAAELLRDIGLEKTAYLAGMVHDLGKFSENFKNYIEKAANGEKVQRGSVNHTFAGVRFLLKKHSDEQLSGFSDIILEILAYAVGAHHGLFDCVDDNNNNGFTKRIQKEGIDYLNAAQEFLKICCSEQDIEDLLKQSEKEFLPVFNEIEKLADNADAKIQNTQITFYIGFLARLILSAIIEADRSDTAQFMNGYSEKTVKNISEIWINCIKNVEQKLSTMPLDKPINKTRAQISALCAEAGNLESGIYRLNLPTGAGKTLTSLRYALHHALAHNKKRIIFTMPLLSIIEQNAGIIHDYIGNEELILEHHSNIVETDENDELDKRELLVESWDVPIIITTMVQLLNTLFAGKTANIRRMQALCNSIIVIDEVQTVPDKMLSLFNLALNFLAKICNATIILCSATQPCFEKTMYPLDKSVKDLITLTKEQETVFKRVRLEYKGEMDCEELADFAAGILEENNRLLLVCNTKNEAAVMFNLLCSKLKDVKAFHISAGMCTAHRKETIKEMQEALKNKQQKVLCVSTQVIEAGVDVSFARVIRLLAGMDNIVQATGRENRNREFDGRAPGYIVRLKGEFLKGLSEIEAAKNAAANLLVKYRNNPQIYDDDLMSAKAVNEYYKSLYENVKSGYHDFYIESVRDSILNLMSCNGNVDSEKIPEYNKYFMHQALKTAGGLFTVFDESSIDIIVPYDRGTEIIQEVFAVGDKDYEKLKAILKEAKLYTVSLFKYQKIKLEEQGALIFVPSAGVYILQDGYYDELTGLNLNQSELPLQMY
ncbi:CRISPR-associated helicase Cas3' [Phascolarctobacterium faecium]|nr:CRISPR-associated helicase Cas3' [Phascolarctobacterium faecium]MDM8111042.1 CRISPR-associated helicase Cas3' [Phascolarctobacterium faecium]